MASFDSKSRFLNLYQMGNLSPTTHFLYEGQAVWRCGIQGWDHVMSPDLSRCISSKTIKIMQLISQASESKYYDDQASDNQETAENGGEIHQNTTRKPQISPQEAIKQNMAIISEISKDMARTGEESETMLGGDLALSITSVTNLIENQRKTLERLDRSISFNASVMTEVEKQESLDMATDFTMAVAQTVSSIMDTRKSEDGYRVVL